jgi:nucleoside-diphosphate-sugar epimerase
MRICIVGGTGNISTSIVRVLLQQGHEVICCNRGRSGALPAGARRLECDRLDRPAFEAAMQRERFDAAIDMIGFNRDDALSSMRAFRGVRHFLHCSTVCTYGVEYDWLPVSEDHPLRPVSDYGRNKVAADHAYLEAYHQNGFPVTVIKPSTTYGPRLGLLRQIAWEFSWIDRVRQGKPVVVCGDGNAIHQFLHVDDAALGFAGILGRERCIGQCYNLVNRGFTTWAAYHRTAMRVIGREVEMVGVPFATLDAWKIPNFGICRDIFAHHVYYSADKLFRDVPEFRPVVTLEQGMTQVLDAMDREGRVPEAGRSTWEDELIAAQRRVACVTDAGP